VLVMELVEGQTLSTLIDGRPMPCRDAVHAARQIVDALDYAHEKNVLHRDLKPANVRPTADGTVKLLDFGLARALDPLEPIGTAPSPDDSPTMTSPAATVPGAILGTAAYMAPEQVRGRPLDRRADIWAFGCVLFEMLSGQRAFPGETVPDTLAAVLKGEPDWTRLPADVPGAVRALLQHCLAADPKARVRHIADARLFLSDHTVPPGSSPPPVRPSRWAIPTTRPSSWCAPVSPPVRSS
jgi:serine/threonine-protein kinase